MKRLLAVLACLAIALPAWGEKSRVIPRQPRSPTAPNTATITGSPLTIVVGDETSLRVYTSAIPSSFDQFNPPDCNAGATANAGTLAGIAGVVYGPDFEKDRGFSFGAANGAGGQGADGSCNQLQYSITWLGTTPASAWTAQGYSSVWGEILAGHLDDTVDPTCIDNGAALEWTGLSVSGTPVVIGTGVSFTDQAVVVSAVVPALSIPGLVALVALLAVVGYVLAKKNTLGA